MGTTANIKRLSLNNGSNLIFCKKEGDLAHARFLFNVGSFNEDSSNYGVSHLIEHLVFGANPDKSSEEFTLEMRNFGASINASTGHEWTRFYFTSLTKTFVKAFESYFNQVKGFKVSEEILEKEKKVVCQEVDVTNDDNWSRVYYNLMDSCYSKHPASVPVIGYKDIINNLSVADVQAFYDKFYVSGNLSIIITGNLDDEELESLIKICEDFHIGEGTGRFSPESNNLEQFEKSCKSYKADINQNFVNALIPFKLENFEKAALASIMIGDGLGSFLWNEFREKRSIAYVVNSSISALDKDNCFLFFCTAVSNSDDIPLAIELFQDSVKYLKTVSEDKFEESRIIALTKVSLGSETVGALASELEDLISREIDTDTSDWQKEKLEELTYSDFIEFVKSLEESLDSFAYSVLSPKEVNS